MDELQWKPVLNRQWPLKLQPIWLMQLTCLTLDLRLLVLPYRSLVSLVNSRLREDESNRPCRV